MKRLSERLPKLFFILSLLVISVVYGYVSHRTGIFPSPLINKAEEGLRMAREKTKIERPWYYAETDRTQRTTIFQPDMQQPGLTLVAGLGPDNRQFAQVLDEAGNVVHRWDLDWFKLWPNATHLDPKVKPKSRPGAIVHGFLLTEDGGLIFNYDALGMVRIDVNGDVVWRLPLETHHSLERDGNGHIWTSVQRTHNAPIAGLPNYEPPFYEYTVVEISPEDGRMIQEVSIFDLLRENGLQGLLYLTTSHVEGTTVGGDTLHVNDVQVFPAEMEPGYFRPGDIMVSLRQVNAVVVFDFPRRKVKYVSVGAFVRQHDPDFVDGNTLSVFDNNNVGDRASGVQSRILVQAVPAGDTRVAFEGTVERPFFSNILGKHQWLPNGNLLLVESTAGRVLEVDPTGHPVAEFVNLVGDHLTGVVSEGTRLPPEIDAQFFAQRRAETSRAVATLASRR